MRKLTDAEAIEKIYAKGSAILSAANRFSERLQFFMIDTDEMRRVFDDACDEIHYAGACKRVGRCMRLAILHRGLWVGGIVLGSTFPNIKSRDEYFGLSAFLEGWSERGLVSPWARENKRYWNGLQLIVNHARTFVFPRFQGRHLGISAHKLLLTEGKRLWEERYKSLIYGFDTLCTHRESRLFADNGWKLVGRTQGYSRDPQKIFSKRAFLEDYNNVRDNAGLGKLEGNHRWWIWVKVMKQFSFD